MRAISQAPHSDEDSPREPAFSKDRSKSAPSPPILAYGLFFELFYIDNNVIWLILRTLDIRRRQGKHRG